MKALKLLMVGSNVEEAERDRILEEFRNTSANLNAKISIEKDRMVK